MSLARGLVVWKFPSPCHSERGGYRATVLCTFLSIHDTEVESKSACRESGELTFKMSSQFLLEVVILTFHHCGLCLLYANSRQELPSIHGFCEVLVTHS